MGAKKKILFVLSPSLGWSTYQRRVTDVARRRTDMDASFYVCRPTLVERLMMRQLPGRTLRRPVDPLFVWRRHMDARRRTLDLDGFDAVHVATQVNALAFAERRDGPPFSVMIDLTRISPRNELEQAWFSRRSLAAERLVFERAAFIGALGSHARDALIENYDIAPDKVHLVPPSIRMPDTPVHSGSGDGPVNIAFIGNDFARKGGPALLRLHQERLAGRARLHIVSGGFSPGAGLVNVVHHRYIPNERIVEDFLPSMDIFCLPSLSDQAPWVCVEAAAAGVPMVATRVGGLADLCIDGETGFLVERGDTEALAARLERLIDDPALRRDMGRRAHEFARQSLDAERNYNRLIDLILR